jgi:HAD superfamily hydrolase (TIGR01549 family)
MAALHEYDPSRTLLERFYDRFVPALSAQGVDLRAFFSRFYSDHYPDVMRPFVTVQQGAVDLVQWLKEQGYELVVATNPGLPLEAAHHRMRLGGLAPEDFTLITTLETMHFGKPQPEYYEEILVRLDLEPGEAIMVGDDWENDMAPALAAGLSAYWLNDALEPPNEAVPRIDGHGSFSQFAARARAGWLATLHPHDAGYQSLVRRLAAFPAGIAAAIDGLPRAVLECTPGEHEWSARDIICHLRDHDAEEDRTRLERILREEHPFVSGNYDPWAHAHGYEGTSAQDALSEFVRYRADMVSWLGKLPPEVWSRPARHAIFGPTSFEEMVRFATEHDRTHFRQMRSALEHAVLVCGI